MDLFRSKNRTPHFKIPLAAIKMEQKPKTASKNRIPLIKMAINRKPSGFEKPHAAFKFWQKPKTAARNRKPHLKMGKNRMPPAYNPHFFDVYLKTDLFIKGKVR